METTLHSLSQAGEVDELNPITQTLNLTGKKYISLSQHTSPADYCHLEDSCLEYSPFLCFIITKRLKPTRLI